MRSWELPQASFSEHFREVFWRGSNEFLHSFRSRSQVHVDDVVDDNVLCWKSLFQVDLLVGPGHEQGVGAWYRVL